MIRNYEVTQLLIDHFMYLTIDVVKDSYVSEFNLHDYRCFNESKPYFKPDQHNGLSWLFLRNQLKSSAFSVLKVN